MKNLISLCLLLPTSLLFSQFDLEWQSDQDVNQEPVLSTYRGDFKSERVIGLSDGSYYVVGLANEKDDGITGRTPTVAKVSATGSISFYNFYDVTTPNANPQTLIMDADVDDSDNLYVLVYRIEDNGSLGNNDYRAVILKIGSNGSLLMEHAPEDDDLLFGTLKTESQFGSIAVMGNGTFYVGGRGWVDCESGEFCSNEDFVIAKYTNSGGYLGHTRGTDQTHNFAGDIIDGRISDMVLAPNDGALFVTGQIANNAGTQAALTQAYLVDDNVSIFWERLENDANSGLGAAGKRIIVDASLNVFTVSTLLGYEVIQKIQGGTLKYSNYLSDIEDVNNIQLDGSGNLYYAGKEGSGFVKYGKINSSGSNIWDNKFGASESQIMGFALIDDYFFINYLKDVVVLNSTTQAYAIEAASFSILATDQTDGTPVFLETITYEMNSLSDILVESDGDVVVSYTHTRDETDDMGQDIGDKVFFDKYAFCDRPALTFQEEYNFCTAPGSISLDAISDQTVTFIWKDDIGNTLASNTGTSTTLSITVSSSGTTTYFLEASNATGCAIGPYEVEVIVDANPFVEIEVLNDGGCENPTLVATEGFAFYTWIWDGFLDIATTTENEWTVGDGESGGWEVIAETTSGCETTSESVAVSFSDAGGFDFFWKTDGGGQWSNANNWTGVTGGSVAFNCAPDFSNDITIDALSLNQTSEIVIDLDSEVDDFDVSLLDEQLTLSSNGSDLSIRGVFLLSPNLTSSAKFILNTYFGADFTLDQNGADLSDATIDIDANSSSSIWDLGSDLNVQSLLIRNGGFDFNTHTTNTTFLTVLNSEQVDLAGSTINTFSLTVDIEDANDFVAGTSTINVENGNIQILDPITLNNLNISGEVTVRGNFSVNNLTITPGSLVEFEAGAEITILNSFEAPGNTSTELPLRIYSADVSDPGTISKSSGEIVLEGVELQDIVGTGGATFKALNSTNLGANTGWSFIELYTWNGTSWNATEEPAANKDLHFAGNYTISDVLESSSIYVEPGTTITIADGAVLQDNNEIENDGTIEVESGGSLVLMGDAFGSDYQIHRNITTSGGYSILGGMVNGMTVADLSADYIFWYDGTDYSIPDPSDNLSAGKGYFVGYGDPNPSISFVGSPYTNNRSFGLPFSNAFHLVANPYAAPISHAALVVGNTSFDGTIYLWDDGGSNSGDIRNGGYVTVNAAGMASGNAGLKGSAAFQGEIGSAQGFFIFADQATSIDFTPAMQSAVAGDNDDDQFYRFDELEYLRLELQVGEQKDELLIAFMNEATDELDRGLDARKFINPSVSFYSMVDNAQLAIQALPQINGEQIIPIGYQSKVIGEASINVTELPEVGEVYLLNKNSGQLFDLRIQSSFSIQLRSGTINDQLAIVRNANILSLDEIQKQITVFGDENKLTVQYPVSGSFRVVIYGLDGREVFDEIIEFDGKQSIIESSLMNDLIYILKIDSKTQKFMLK